MARNSRLTWWTMPMPGGHDLEGVEGLHAPLQELVALAVARELDVEVLGERLGAAGEIHLDGVVDHQVDRHQGLDHLRVLAHARDRRAHRGEVDQERHAREVLQHDAGDDEGDLLGARRLRLPARQGPDRVLGHALAVAVAKERLEDDAGSRPAAARRRARPSRGTGASGISGPRRSPGTSAGSSNGIVRRLIVRLPAASFGDRRLDRGEIRQVLRRGGLLGVLDDPVGPDDERGAGARVADAGEPGKMTP